MKNTGTIAIAGLLVAAISTSSAAVAQNYFARVKVREAAPDASSNAPAPTGAWRHVIERTYDCRQKGAWLETQYLPACVVSGAIASDPNCSTTKPAPIGDTTIADPAAAGCPILTERSLI